MAPKRVLLLDSAFSALPIYAYLASLNIDLWVMGSREDDVLAKEAGQKWIKQDYSSVSAVKTWLEDNDCSLIVPGCTDVSLSVASAVGTSRHIDGLQTINVFGDKARFRALCSDLGLPIPLEATVGDFPRAGRFICKPADSFSGRGITIFDGSDVDAISQSKQTALDASPSRSVVFEEYIEGQLYSFTGFLENNYITHSFFVQEGSSANRFAVDTSFVVRDMPSSLSAAFADYAHLISERLGLRDGLLHVQFILRDGMPFLIEATRRCPGDLYANLIEYSTGFPYAAKYASYFIGEQLASVADEGRFVVRHTVSSTLASTNVGMRFNTPMNVRSFFPIQKMGDTLLPNQKARSGILFVEAPTQEAASDVYDAFLDRRAYKD